MSFSPATFSNQTVLVTGASGFIGRAVVEQLLAAGARVRAGYRQRPTPLSTSHQVEWVRADLTEVADCQRLVAGCEVVFHVAGDYRFWAADPADIYRNNIVGTRNLLMACRDHNVRRVVCTGTPAIFAPAKPGQTADESRVLSDSAGLGPYKRSKLQAWQLAQQFQNDMAIIHVFPTAVIGPGDLRPTPTGRILLEFANGRMPMLARTGLSFVPVDSVATGHLQAMEHGRRGENYLLSGHNLWLRDFLQIAGDYLNRPVSALDCPYAIRWIAALVAEWGLARWSGQEPFAALEAVRMSRRTHFFDHRKAAHELGYCPGPLPAAITGALQAFKNHGMLRLNGTSRRSPTSEPVASASAEMRSG